jgi:ferritin
MADGTASQNEEDVREHLKRHSKANIDEYVLTTTFADVALHDVSANGPTGGRLHYGGSSSNTGDPRTYSPRVEGFLLLPQARCRRRSCQHRPARLFCVCHEFCSAVDSFQTFLTTSPRFFKRAAAESLADAMWLENYLINRGGRCIPMDLPAPIVHFPDNPVDPVIPVYEALQVEKELFEDVLRLCTAASKCRDYALEGAIESRLLKRVSKCIKDMGDFLQQCVRVSKQVDHGVYHLDRELRECDGKIPWAKYNIPDKSDCLLEEVGKELRETCWGS